MKLSTRSYPAHGSFRRLLPLLLLPIAMATATAQSMNSFTMQEGLSAATQAAHDSLGADATLETVSAHAVPVLDTWPPIDFMNGTAGYWSYTFFSPSSGEQALVSAQKPGPSVVASVDAMMPISMLPPEIDLTGDYLATSKLPDRLATDTTYQHFHSTNPDMVPMTIQLGPPMFSSTVLNALPASFPLDKQVWQVIFAAAPSAMESNLTCIVVSSTGETFCLEDIVAIASVNEPGTQAQTSARLTASPNPASGLVRIDLPENALHITAGAKAELFDALGNRVRDLSDDLTLNGGAFVTVDTHELPAGLYICRANSGSWSASMGIVVRH